MEPPGTNCMKMLTMVSSRLVPRYLNTADNNHFYYSKTEQKALAKCQFLSDEFYVPPL